MIEEIEAHKPAEQEPGKESPAPLCSADNRSCRDCRYCGPERPGGNILCDHPSWTHWDEVDRIFDAEFGDECPSFEASEQNAQGDSQSPDQKS